MQSLASGGGGVQAFWGRHSQHASTPKMKALELQPEDQFTASFRALPAVKSALFVVAPPETAWLPQAGEAFPVSA
jgi:hypothetical protein